MANYDFSITFPPKPNTPNFVDLTGQRFGRLIVVQYWGVHKITRRTHATWLCLCDCDKEKIVATNSLRSGKTQSCGCYRIECYGTSNLRHGHARKNKATAEYRAYAHAKGRCQDVNDAGYPDYGGRGIEFRFESFEQFFAEVGRKPAPTDSLDRIDVNGHYESGNLRWADRTTQARNRTIVRDLTVGEITLSVPEWGDRNGIEYKTIHSRLRANWCGHCAVTIQNKVGSNQRSGCPHRN